jgi:hypothetical protein
MEVVSGGGGEPVPDSDREQCLGLWYQLDLERLPENTESLDITFDDPAARDWHLSADWPHTRVWTEDDLAISMRTHAEFVVRWEPADEALPALALVNGGWHGAWIELIDREPGRARYRFEGREPDTIWNVSARREGHLENTSCSGFGDCEFYAGGDTALLHPVGIPPIRPDGIAPPRECIGAPGEPRGHGLPSWQQFPELSTVHVSRSDACDGADFYFVLLGACGVCGDGSSTYVVGNRGTAAASFSVRSNAQTVAGELLEPQQLSAPFEIAFGEWRSQIEILSDGDCDATSNSEWVASVSVPTCRSSPPL